MRIGKRQAAAGGGIRDGSNATHTCPHLHTRMPTKYFHAPTCPHSHTHQVMGKSADFRGPFDLPGTSLFRDFVGAVVRRYCLDSPGAVRRAKASSGPGRQAGWAGVNFEPIP